MSRSDRVTRCVHVVLWYLRDTAKAGLIILDKPGNVMSRQDLGLRYCLLVHEKGRTHQVS